MKNLLIFLLLLAFPTVAADHQIVLEYKGFYDRQKKAADKDYPLVRIAFFLVDSNQDACPLTNAYMLDRDRNTHELNVGENGELLLPFKSELNDVKARMIFDTTREDCMLSFQVLAQDVKQVYTKDELVQTYEQMDGLLDDLGGMLSFLMPDTTGLRFYFGEVETATQADLRCDKVSCYWLPDDGALDLQSLPSKVTPYIQAND